MVRIHLFILTFLLSTGAAATPMLTTDGSGNVTGATGLEAGGATYSMEFVDGSCIDLFDGCDSNADFIVPGTGDVTHGSLLSTFFDAFIASELTADDGSLDAQPDIAIGCERVSLDFCTTVAPTASHSSTEYVALQFTNRPYDVDFLDEPPITRIQLNSVDLTNKTFFNHARFALQPTAAPLPGTLPLVALGLLVLGLRRKGNTA